MAKVQIPEEILPTASTPCMRCTNIKDRQTDLRWQISECQVVTFG